MTMTKRVYLHSPCKTDAGSNISLAGAKKFCRDKHVCCNKTHFLSMKKMLVLLQQNYVCHDKTFVATNICRNQHTFVATSILFLRQTHVCHDKTFVATKMILVATPANDRNSYWQCHPRTHKMGLTKHRDQDFFWFKKNIIYTHTKTKTHKLQEYQTAV